MKYWNSDSWGVEIRRDDETQRLVFKRPVALIGSHPSCDVQINDRHLSPVVYLAVAANSHLEIWPVAPIAYPVWGRITSAAPVVLGRTSLRFFMARPASESPPQVAPQEPEAELIFHWGTGERRKPLNRRVSILGDSHPSTIRMHGVGLNTCHCGFICVGDQVWLVNLDCDSPEFAKSPVVSMKQKSPSLVIGRVHVWLGDKGPFSEALSKDSQPDLQPESVFEGDTRPDVFQSTTHQPQEADEFATHFTDRLLTKSNKRALRDRQLRMAIAGILLAIALAALLAIAFWGVIPMIRGMYSS